MVTRPGGTNETSSRGSETTTSSKEILEKFVKWILKFAFVWRVGRVGPDRCLTAFDYHIFHTLSAWRACLLGPFLQCVLLLTVTSTGISFTTIIKSVVTMAKSSPEDRHAAWFGNRSHMGSCWETPFTLTTLSYAILNAEVFIGIHRVGDFKKSNNL